MVEVLGRRIGTAAVITVLVSSVLAGCAPKSAPTVTPAGAPRHPEFVFPAATPPPDASTLQEHETAWQLLQAGDTRNAERRYNALLKRVPTFYAAHVGLGYVALARNDASEALEHFDRALAVDPGYAPGLAGKGQAYLAMNQRDQALASFDAALAADPGLASIRSAADVLRFQGLQGGVAGARKAAEAGRYAEARAAYLEAIKASPQSPFLYRELAVVERQNGQLAAAQEQIEKAISIDPNDARSFVVLAEVLEAMGQYEKAATALTNAAALEPSDAIHARIEGLRAKAAFEAMPAEFRAIEQAETVTRAQLAALIGIRLEALVKRTPPASVAVMTDARGNWAAQWILPVTRAGFMEVYGNHTFQPSAIVRRGDLAMAASRILSAIARENPRLGAGWRNARQKFSDLPPGHLSYSAASMAVAAGVMQPVENGAFQLSRAVTGAEAVAAINRLVELAERRR
jgi:tetratricopeptide (TPR) repeat protein